MRKYCDSCSYEVYETFRVCPNCGGQSFSDAPKPTQIHKTASTASSVRKTAPESRPRNNIDRSTRSWGIFALACALAFFGLMNSQPMYVVIWGYVAFQGYKGNLSSIYYTVLIVLIVNIIVLLVLLVYADGDTWGWLGYESADWFFIQIGLSLAIKLGILLYVRQRMKATGSV